jgi:hypothetical protein
MPGREEAASSKIYLAITRRCRRSDLQDEASAALAELAARHPVVEAFCKLRSQHPIGNDRVESLASDVEVYTVQSGETVGATWYQAEGEQTVWLLAVAPVGSNPRDYFGALDADGELLPSEQDLAKVIADRLGAAAPAVLVELSLLFGTAQEADGAERAFSLSDGTNAKLMVSCEEGEVVEVVATFSERRPSLVPHSFLLGAILPEVPEEGWQRLRRLPHRALEPGERAFRYRAKRRS